MGIWLHPRTMPVACGYAILEGVQEKFPTSMEEKIHNLKNRNCRWFTRDSSLVEPEVALKDMQKGGKIQNAVQ